MIIIACVACGKPFRAKTKHDKMCSKLCREQRAKAQRAKWFKDHKGDMAEYWHQYHAAHREERNAANLARYYKRQHR